MNKLKFDSIKQNYRYGFNSNIATISRAKGLDISTIRFISRKKNEPQWLLKWRIKAFQYWQQLKEPHWCDFDFAPINYQDISYFAAPENHYNENSDQLDPEISKTFEKLGIPLREKKRLTGIAIDAVLDSVSVATTYKKRLNKYGIIFCSFSEAVQKHPNLIKKYLGSIVPYSDNFFAALNAAVFSDGSFVYIPKGVKCPMDLSTYFRINTASIGQFERTLIVVEENASVKYLEGCTAPRRDKNQLHAAVVEIIALDNASVEYSTVQNWYPGDKNGRGGIYNFVTKRGLCKGDNSRISWTQVETGSALTWKYPSVILKGDNSKGNFYSISLTSNKQKADTGTKMYHLGKNTTSTIISKSIATNNSKSTYRGLVEISSRADNSHNYSQCDSLLIGNKSATAAYPKLINNNNSGTIAHEATASKISEEQLLYCGQRGINPDEAAGMIVNGFCKSVLNHLPMEFATEAHKLLELKLEGSIG